VDGKPDVSRVERIDLERLGRENRMQTVVFRAAAQVFDQLRPGWSGSREALLGQVIGLVDRFLASDRVRIEPQVFARDALRRRILLMLHMNRIVQHLFDAIRPENAVARELVLDREHPLRATGDMLPWYTAKPCAAAARSHVNFCVYDSAWEAGEAYTLDHDPHVEAWVKNDHLGFEVTYLFQGGVHKFRPDFLVRLANGSRLVLEVKGQDTQKDRAKRGYLAEWVEAVNEHGGFGRWAADVSLSPSDLPDILARHAAP
jgi:type III restriction enzyme